MHKTGQSAYLEFVTSDDDELADSESAELLVRHLLVGLILAGIRPHFVRCPGPGVLIFLPSAALDVDVFFLVKLAICAADPSLPSSSSDPLEFSDEKILFFSFAPIAKVVGPTCSVVGRSVSFSWVADAEEFSCDTVLLWNDLALMLPLPTLLWLALVRPCSCCCC